MTTEASTRAEALAELAAIRRAKAIYRQPKALAKAEATEAAAEAEARAKAGTTDSNGMAAGQVVRAGTAEATAKAEAAAKARAGLPKVTEAKAEAKAARLAWHTINGREYAAAEAREFWAEQRRMDTAARAKARAEARRAELSLYSAGTVLDGMTAAELTEAAAKAARRAAKAGTKAEARAARQAPAAAETHLELTARAAALGVDVTELIETEAAEALMAATGRDDTTGKAPEAGAYSTMSPTSYVLFKSWTRQQLASPAAAAGRQALDAMGVTAQAVVTVPYNGQQLTISELSAVPNVETAKARAKAAKAAAKAARAKAKAAIKAAEATHMTREKLAKAEAEAGRLAELSQRAEAKAAKAKAIKAAAKAAEAIPGHATGWVAIPVAKLSAAEAEAAGSLPVRRAAGLMPSTFAHKGPSAKAARAKTDNTATEAIANVMGQTAEAEAAAAEALAAGIRAKLAELAEAAAAARDKQRTDYKARQALALRIKRRAAKNK